MIEIFKEIKDFPNYHIGNFGNVKSLNYKKSGKEGLLKGGVDSGGYRTVALMCKGKGSTKKIHQLVAMAFLGHVPCGHDLVVNHKDFNKLNNRLNNLEVVTARENLNQKHRKSSSKYTGVSSRKQSKKWASSIFLNGKKKYLGAFNTEKEASEYYENAVLAIKNNTEIIVQKPNFTSKYKGVSRYKPRNEWQAQATVNGKNIHLGFFDCEIKASMAYENFKKTL